MMGKWCIPVGYDDRSMKLYAQQALLTSTAVVLYSIIKHLQLSFSDQVLSIHKYIQHIK